MGKFNKKIIFSNVIILLLCINVINISAINIRNDSVKNVIISSGIVINTLPDELDQYQNISDVEYQIYEDQYIAQTFRPTLNTLTRIKVLIKKTIDVDLPDLFVQIENNYMELIGFSSLKSSDLTEEYTWYEFDFEPDININVDEIYSIIIYSYCNDISECYSVSCSMYNEYDRGSFLTSANGISWNLVDDIDLCFETYGFNSEPPVNNPPNKPFKPSGESSGNTGDEYSYQTSTSDPDGDQIYYMWDWGDETSSWLGPYEGGVTISTTHNWDEDGEYTIKVKAKDEHGEESEWSDPLTVTMPRAKSLNQMSRIILWLFEQFQIIQLFF
jgi:hypothetical protein